MRTSGQIKMELQALASEQRAVLATYTDGLPADVAGEVKTRDRQIQALLNEFEDAKANEDRATTNREAMSQVFGTNRASSPTSDRPIDQRMNPGGGLAGAIFDAGWNLRSHPSVKITGPDLFAALSTDAGHYRTPATYRVDPIATIGMDRRWLWSSLPVQPVGPETTSVDDWSQAARSLAGDVERALAATTEKAVLTVDLAFANTALKTLAVLITDVPTQLLASMTAARSWLNSEGLYQLQTALDGHVQAQITAATPTTEAFATDVLTSLRNGVGSMRANGYNPNLLAVDTTDAATLDLLSDNTNNYILSSPGARIGPHMVWDVQTVEVTGSAVPTLIDTTRVGQLYVGGMDVLFDPYSKLSTNLVQVRFEMSCLFWIRQSDAIRLVDITA